MPIVACKSCDKKFYAKPNWLEKGFGKYCSITCRGLDKRKGKEVFCFVCNKRVYKSLKDLQRSKSKKYFCTKQCNLCWQSSWQFGERHGNWKVGEFSYKNIIKRKGVSAHCRLCGKDDSRILLVHHLDKNRKNNKWANLTWLCFNCHFLVHHDKKSESIVVGKIKKEYGLS